MLNDYLNIINIAKFLIRMKSINCKYLEKLQLGRNFKFLITKLLQIPSTK